LSWCARLPFLKTNQPLDKTNVFNTIKLAIYIPPHFAENRPQALFDIMTSHPLGTLVTQSTNGLEANHLPFEMDTCSVELGTLRAHVARANPIWQETTGDDDVLVIFRGLDAYVSPNWYPSKHDTHRQVPTIWNYQAMHVYGKIKFIEDVDCLHTIVEGLTHTHGHKTQSASLK